MVLATCADTLALIAGGVGAAVALPAEVIAKQQLVVACPLGAVGATASGGNKLRVPLVERRILQDEQDIGVNPELQVADGQQDTRWLRCSVVVYLFEAGFERVFLLVGGQLRQQQRMAYADLIGIERIDRCGYKVGQFQPRRHEDGSLAHLRGDLLDAVLGFVQVQQGAEALRLFHRVNLGANQVLD